MRRPPFPFAMMLTRAEEERDERQRVYLRKRESWRQQQRAVDRQEAAIGDLYQHLAQQRTSGAQGAWAHNHLLFAGREQGRLRDLAQRERHLAAEAEKARQGLMRAALQMRVWETLRDRFWKEWETQQRRREEAELEDWSRSRLKPPRSRAVV